MLDVLLLLAITWRLFQCLDDERRGRGDDRDRSLTVLDGELDSYSETFLFTEFSRRLLFRHFLDEMNIPSLQ